MTSEQAATSIMAHVGLRVCGDCCGTVRSTEYDNVWDGPVYFSSTSSLVLFSTSILICRHPASIATQRRNQNVRSGSRSTSSLVSTLGSNLFPPCILRDLSASQSCLRVPFTAPSSCRTIVFRLHLHGPEYLQTSRNTQTNCIFRVPRGVRYPSSNSARMPALRVLVVNRIASCI